MHGELGKTLDLTSGELIGSRSAAAVPRKKERLSLLNRSQPNHESNSKTNSIRTLLLPHHRPNKRIPSGIHATVGFGVGAPGHVCLVCRCSCQWCGCSCGWSGRLSRVTGFQDELVQGGDVVFRGALERHIVVRLTFVPQTGNPLHELEHGRLSFRCLHDCFQRCLVTLVFLAGVTA